MALLPLRRGRRLDCNLNIERIDRAIHVSEHVVGIAQFSHMVANYLLIKNPRSLLMHEPVLEVVSLQFHVISEERVQKVLADDLNLTFCLFVLVAVPVLGLGHPDR